jgi:hypothetical protein
MPTRTKSFISPRRRSTATQNGSSGTTRLQRPLDCTCHLLPASCLPSSSSPNFSQHTRGRRGIIVGGIRLIDNSSRYAVSLVIHRALWFMNGGCSETSLRMTNWVAIILLILTAVDCRQLIETRIAERRQGQPRPSSLSFHAIHTGINIGLFPLLFFFSALYYTDVFSTLMVLFAFQNHLKRVGTQGKSWQNDLFIIFLGVASLCMRQTNIFWVVVFMGGLEAVEAAKPVPATRPPPPSQGDPVANTKYFTWTSSLGEVYDPALNEASLDGQYLLQKLSHDNMWSPTWL